MLDDFILYRLIVKWNARGGGGGEEIVVIRDGGKKTREDCAGYY